MLLSLHEIPVYLLPDPPADTLFSTILGFSLTIVPVFLPVTMVKVTGKNKKGKKLSKTLKCAVTVKNPKITAAPAQTVKVGATASVKPSVKPASAKLSYKSSDAAVAAVDANGVVTGVAAGKATVTVTAKVGTKTLTAKTEVTVEANEVVLSEVKQTASNAFTAVFSGDVSKTVTKDSFTIEKADKTLKIPALKADISADGKTVAVTLADNMEDGAKYNITCQNTTKELTASVGAVTKIEILTTKAQQGKKTPIEFRLMDANGIDVTPAKNIDATCLLDVTGTYSSAQKDTPSKATITMDKIGDKADVKITYDSGIKDAQPVSATGTIECVKAEAEKGTGIFRTTTTVNGKSKCAKFYLNRESDKEVSVTTGKETTVYFCALGSTVTEAVSYDKYEVKSSNEDVCGVTATKDTGKYLEIKVSGNSVGSSSLIVTATKYGVPTSYVIPVTVIKDNLAVKMEASIKTIDAQADGQTTVTMSDSPDTDYKATISVKFYDEAGKDVTTDTVWDAEIKNDSTDKYEKNVDGITVTPSASTADVKVGTGAKEKTYLIRVSGQDKNASTVLSKTLRINVKKLPKEALNATGSKMTYRLASEKQSLDMDSNTTTEIRGYATCGSLFAGYLSANGEIAKNQVHASNPISDVQVAVKYGTEYYQGSAAGLELTSANQLEGKTVSTVTMGAINLHATARSVKVKTVGATTCGAIIFNGSDTFQKNGYIVKTDGKTIDNSTWAKPGRYDIKLVYTEKGKTLTEDNYFQVTRPGYAPTVITASRKVGDLTAEKVIEQLSTDVDLNNDTGSNQSIIGVVCVQNNTEYYHYGSQALETTGSGNNQAYVKYAVVMDTTTDNTGTPVYYYVSIGSTFTLK